MSSENFVWEFNNYDIPKFFDFENDNLDLNPSPIIFTSENIFKNEICLNLPSINQITLPSSDYITKKNNKSPKKKVNSKSKQINKVLGRKRKDCDEKGAHTRDSQDNIIRKVKVIFKDCMRKQINGEMSKIDNLYIDINGKEYKLDKILDIKQDKIVDINTLSNRELLSSKVKDLFRDDISGRYTKYPKNYNKIAIDKLYEANVKSVTSILDLKILDCFRFFRDDDIVNDDNFSCLKGLEKRFKNLQNELKEKKNSQNYINRLINVIKEFEKIYYNDKKPRHREQSN